MTSHHKTNLRLDWCSHEAAKYAVEHWHYSRAMPKSKLAKIGVWENDRFIGVVIFGVGATSALVTRYGLTPIEGCELIRVALTSHQSPVSRIVAIALSMIRRTYSGLRLVVSFADPEQGHTGGIYQAGGWIYSGRTQSSPEYIFAGKRWQGRSWRNSHDATTDLASVEVVMGSSKHRYLMPLDAEMRARILPLAVPYPKRASEASSDAPAIHAGEGGAAPTLTLQQ